MRDLIPEEIRGQFLSKRLAWSFSLAMPVSLVAGRFVDFWQIRFPTQPAFGYSIIFLIAFAFGVGSVFTLRLTTEPQMEKLAEKSSLKKIISSPFKDINFRKMLKFTTFWGVASNFAIPFFTVYMLERIGLSLTTVVVFSVITQLFYILFLGVWGRLTDKFSNKSVMQVSGVILLICIIAWPFTTLPEIYFATLPILTLIHIFLGIALAGVSLTSFNIAFKLAPRNEAPRYLAVNGAMTSIAMGVGPILGGLLADVLALMELSLTFRWYGSQIDWTAYLLNFRGLDFLFFAAFTLGLYSLYLLAQVREEGEASKGIVYRELINETRKGMRNIYNVTVLHNLIYFALKLHKRRKKTEPF